MNPTIVPLGTCSYHHYKVLNTEIPPPALLPNEKAMQEFICISNYFNCAIFGEDFNSVFMIDSPKQEYYNIRLAFLKKLERKMHLEVLYELMKCIIEKYDGIDIYMNKKGVYIRNMFVEDKCCTLTISNCIYSDLRDVLQARLSSQEMCIYSGVFYASARCAETLKTGIAFINLSKHHQFFEHEMYGEFCKGFGIAIQDMYISNSEKYDVDIIEKFILSIPKYCFSKTPLHNFVCLEYLTLIPHVINDDSMECSLASWYHYIPRPKINYLRENTRILSKGDIADFYITLRYKGYNVWSKLIKYELKHARRADIESYKMFFDPDCDLDAIFDVHQRKLTELDNQLSEDMEFILWETEASVENMSSEKWLNKYYEFIL